MRGIDNISSSTKPYWSAQANEQAPARVVLPPLAGNASIVIKVLGDGIKRDVGDCKFAIRSGG